MKIKLSLFLIALGFSLQTLGRPLCSSVFTGEFVFFNTNADIPAHLYSRPHYRGLEMTGLILGPAYREVANKLKKGDTVLDAGAGYGLSSIQLVQRKQVVAHAINAQNFWKFLETADPREVKGRIAAITESLKFDLNGIIPKSKFIEATGNYAYGYDWARSSSQMVSNARHAILSEVRSLKTKELFHYHAGYVEKVLPNLDVQFNLIQDLYGAFLYSADRMHILDIYFDKLAVGGSAFIKLRTETGNGVNDLVTLKDGKKIDLSNYLVDQYPEIFSYGTNDKSALIMERKTEDTRLNLEEILMPSDFEIKHFTESEYPNILWKFRSDK